MQGVHRSGSKKRDSAASARYDYFETKATIDGKPYVVAFDVEVYPDTNNYRTHKALNEISLTPIPSAEPGPVPGDKERNQVYEAMFLRSKQIYHKTEAK